MKRDYSYWEGEEGCLRIEGWARDGCTLAEIAKRMEVSEHVLRRLRREVPAIEAAVKNGREATDRKVERALLRRALGFAYTETTCERDSKTGEGHGKEKVTTKYVPPDLSAQIFWLKNRMPDVWRDKPGETGEEREGVLVLDALSQMGPAFYALHRRIMQGEISEAVLMGGRGSCKSSFVSLELITQMLRRSDCHAVVMRRVADTLRNSVYAQLRWAITALSLDALFDCRVSPMQIVYKPTGQTIFFFGLDDPGKLKSLKTPFGYVGILWFEELDQFDGPEEIRSVEQSVLRGGEFSFVFKSFNPPASARSWANVYVREEKSGRAVHHSTYLQTPPEWLGERFLADAQHLRETNETAYRHEYLGEAVGSGAAVFENISARTITDSEIAAFDRVYRGLDWGFYPDPFAYNECCYDAARETLYIFGELSVYREGNAETARRVKERARSEVITADSAEPKSIADYKAAGIACVGAKKGPGSVEHGMKWLQSRRAIVIDPARCPDTYREMIEYEYERTADGTITQGYPDVCNHHIDAIRYALEGVSGRRVAKVQRR